MYIFKFYTRLELNVNGTGRGNHITCFRMYLPGSWHAKWPELWKVFGYLNGRGGRREEKNKIVFLIRIIKSK